MTNGHDLTMGATDKAVHKTTASTNPDPHASKRTVSRDAKKPQAVPAKDNHAER